ncbi:uncharacterized protein CDAR_457241 [Caerostris darwini]|uniref:Uncharacterized protein n=1 Tax=Caerostris darwini TaxID=1538125 RepID=A0AAV4PBM0_9ARAC|nr:uncharacterized protein CDAR_457241 [Caerostris darwini]
MAHGGEADHVTFPSKPPLPCVVHRRVSLRRDCNTTPVFATVKPAATDYRLLTPPPGSRDSSLSLSRPPSCTPARRGIDSVLADRTFSFFSNPPYRPHPFRTQNFSPKKS